MDSPGKCYLSHSWRSYWGPIQSSGLVIGVILMSSHDAVWVWSKPVQLRSWCLISSLIFFIYLWGSNPFICDLTCNDEIKLCWLFHKCTYQRCTSSPMPMRWAGRSLSIQYACLHLLCPQIHKQAHTYTYSTCTKHRGAFTNALFHLCCCVYRLFMVIAWAFSPKCVFSLSLSSNHTIAPAELASKNIKQQMKFLRAVCTTTNL